MPGLNARAVASRNRRDERRGNEKRLGLKPTGCLARERVRN